MMVERILIVAVLAVVGIGVYLVFSRRHLQKAAHTAHNDSLLRGFQTGTPAIVYFTTPTCAPCKTQQTPAIERVREELNGQVQVFRVDATQEMDVAERWGVFSVPTTFILDRNGQPREVNYGVADAKKLKRQLEAVSA